MRTDCNKCRNSKTDKCKSCSNNPNYTNNFEIRDLRDNECQCIECKAIMTERIFRMNKNPKRGICFDCY